MEFFLHADDFGKCSSRTTAIHRLMMEGLIECTSLLVNMDGTDEAVALAKEYQYEDKVCLHLNLFEGMPLTEAVRKTGLCRPSGEFCGAGRKRIMSTCMSPTAVRAIRGEASAQMRLFRDKGFRSNHFDSHEWSLLNPPVWTAVKPLLQQYGFETTRLGSEHWIETRSWFWKHYLRFMNAKVQKTLHAEETWSGSAQSFLASAAGVKDRQGRGELYLHPDIVDGVMVDMPTKKLLPMDDVLTAFSQYVQAEEAQQ